jgi:hypothetical protein
MNRDRTAATRLAAQARGSLGRAGGQLRATSRQARAQAGDMADEAFTVGRRVAANAAKRIEPDHLTTMLMGAAVGYLLAHLVHNRD